MWRIRFLQSSRLTGMSFCVVKGSNFSFSGIQFIFFFSSGYMCIWHTCGSQRITLQSHFSTSIFTWVLGIKFRSLGLLSKCLFLLRYLTGPSAQFLSIISKTTGHFWFVRHLNGFLFSETSVILCFLTVL